MADLEKKVVLTVGTGDSQQTVKGLKEEINQLRDAVLNLNKDTDEYNDAVAKLQDDQRKLNEVMALTKREAVALDGSYDSLVHQMAQLKKEWRATNDEARRNVLGKQINEINIKLKEMDASTGNFQRNVGNYTESAVDAFKALKDEIKAAKNELLQLEEGTDDYNAALQRLGNAQFKLKDMTESAKYATADLGEQLDNVVGITGSVAAGFSAVQGIMVLTGRETENFEKTMVKLQAAMAVVQGLKGLEGLGKQLKGLGTALKSLKGGGYVALLTAIAIGTHALIKNLPVVKKQEERWANQMKASKDAQDNFSQSIEIGNQKLSDRIQILKAQGVAEREVLEIQIATTKAQLDEAQKNLDFAKRSEKAMLERAETMVSGAFKQIYGMSKDKAKEHYAELTAQARETYNSVLQTYQSYLTQLEVLDAQEETNFRNRMDRYADDLKTQEQLLKEQYEKDLADAEKYGYDKTVIEKKYQKDLAELRKKAATGGTQDDPNKVLRESIRERIELEENATRRKLAKLDLEKQKEIENAYATINDQEELAVKLESIERDYAEKEYNIELKLKEDKLALLREWEQNNTDAKMQTVEISQEIADQEIEIEQYKQERLTEIAEQGNKDRNRSKSTPKSGDTSTNSWKRQFEDFGDYWDSLDINGKTEEVMNLATTGLQTAGDILGSITDMYQTQAEKDGEITEKEAKRLKNLQYATASINMLQGAISAYASAMSIPPPVGPIIGAANAAAVIAMGTANLMRIKNTDLTGGSTSTPQMPTSSAYQSDMPFNYTRNITGAQEMEQLNQQQNIKVWISETDLQEANTRVEVRQSESSF